jgi:hypothetical protein
MAERLKITIKNLRLEIEGPAGPVVDTLSQFLASLRPKSDNLSRNESLEDQQNRLIREAEAKARCGSFRMFG